MMKHKRIIVSLIVSLLVLAGAFGAVYLTPSRVYADTAALQLKYSLATGSADLIVGAGKSIKTEYGPLNFSAKSGFDTYGIGMVLMPNGNLGIGTTAPYSKLSVQNDADYNPTLTINTAGILNITNTLSDLVFGIDKDTPYGAWIQHRHATVNGNSYPIILNPLGGNVGIGTTTPDAALDVFAPNNSAHTNLRVFGSVDNVTLALTNTATGGTTWWLDSSGGGSGYGQGNLSFGSGTGFENPVMTLKGSNVGIGTTGPLATLDVAGSASMSGTLTVGNGGTIRPQYGPLTLAYKSDLNAWTTGVTLQDTTGNVGIGTTSPAQKLSVVGTVESTTGGFKFPDGTTQTTASSGSGVPTGSIFMWGTASAPTGYLLADGTAVSRTTYSALFAVIGTTFGVGDGSTTFNVPDMRQRFPIGVAASGTGSTLGGTGGAIDHTHTVGGHTHTFTDLSDSQGAHTHTITSGTRTNGGSTTPIATTTNSSGAHTHTVSGTTATNGTFNTGLNNPPFLSVNFIIKI